MAAPNESQLRFKGNLFARPDYFTTDVQKGSTRTPSGTRVCALSGDFLLGFRDAVIYECGDAYRGVMKNCGRRWGAEFARRFDKELALHYQSPVKSLAAGVVHACLADAFAGYGWGRLTIDMSESESGVLQVELWDSVMPALVKEADRPSDHLMCGLLAAIFSHFSGVDLDAAQTDCPTRGASASRFVIASPARIATLGDWLDSQGGERVSHAGAVARLTAKHANRLHESNGVAAGAH